MHSPWNGRLLFTCGNATRSPTSLPPLQNQIQPPSYIRFVWTKRSRNYSCTGKFNREKGPCSWIVSDRGGPREVKRADSTYNVFSLTLRQLLARIYSWRTSDFLLKLGRTKKPLVSYKGEYLKSSPLSLSLPPPEPTYTRVKNFKRNYWLILHALKVLPDNLLPSHSGYKLYNIRKQDPFTGHIPLSRLTIFNF